ncbi:MAG TPA: dTMP kinase [Dehalococcoidia bacterium]|nr:dTMP kinase [Dehalococcoidia bacterium]
MSLFISFEGGEGSGKSYQSKLLLRRLTQNGIPAVHTFEPGGTALGNSIRRLLKDKKYSISAEAELFLFSASRAQLIHEIVLPSLQAGKVVICDRFSDSTTVYQGFARGLDLKYIDAINKISTRGISPDLTIFLDLPVEEGINRKKNPQNDRFDSEEIAFHSRVRCGFLRLAGENPHKWLVIDAAQSRKQIASIIWQRVSAYLHKELV